MNNCYEKVLWIVLTLGHGVSLNEIFNTNVALMLILLLGVLLYSLVDKEAGCFKLLDGFEVTINQKELLITLLNLLC